jgi:hypothetical protein
MTPQDNPWKTGRKSRLFLSRLNRREGDRGDDVPDWLVSIFPEIQGKLA